VNAWLAIVILVLSAPVSDAATLRLPPALRRAPQAIAQQCPECLATGFMTCGTADVAYAIVLRARRCRAHRAGISPRS
jgi:hypothetical protein